MHLQSAKLCLDCDEIYEGEQCSKCSSTAYWWMYKYVTVMHPKGVKIENRPISFDAMDTDHPTSSVG